MRKYFGTDGVRGEVGIAPITPDFALRLGYAAGKVLGYNSNARPAIIIGKDTRLSGYLFESSLEAGLCYAGIDVYMAGPVPTPAIAYLTKALHLSAGIVISASHNPYTDNGIKFFSAQGTKLDDEIELAIEAELAQPMVMASQLGRVRRLEDSRGRYIEFCKSTVPGLDLTGLKIVLDCANGASYVAAPNVFRELGAEVIKFACEPNGTNINFECGSTHPEHLVQEVITHRADLGIAFDGDGDRVLFVDSSGKIYNGDKLLDIITQAYKLRGIAVDGVVGTVMTNLALEQALNSRDIELVRAKVGDRYVLEELSKRQWLIGGEASGHILCLDKHSTGDAIIAALQVLLAMRELDKPLSELIDWEDYPQVMINVRLNSKIPVWQDLSREIIADAQSALMGVGRVVVRPSGTEPLVRIMVEANNFDLANNWARKIANKISPNA
jgi:phosphoglucosamine mutase